MARSHRAARRRSFFKDRDLVSPRLSGCCNGALSWLAMSLTKTSPSPRSSRARCCFSIARAHLISPSPYTANLDGPWDLTIADGFNQAKIFLSNVLNGTVTRLDVALTDKTVTVTRSTVIATGYTVEPNAAALVLGPTGLAYDAVNDLLYIASTADHAIFVVPQAGARSTSLARGKIAFRDPHLRGPLALA